MQITADNLKKYSSKEYFSKQFCKALEKWKLRGGWTDEMFAHTCGLTREMVRRYKYGKAFPQPDTLTRICKQLGVQPEYFAYSDRLSIYKYAKGHTEEVQISLDDFAAQIGLDPAFIEFVFSNNLISDSDLWRPLAWVGDPFQDDCYARRPLQDTEAYQPGDRYAIQIEGQQVALLCGKADLMKMKDLQTAVQAFIRAWYQQQSEQMDAQTAEANRQAQFKAADGVVYTHPLTYKELCQIDPYMKSVQLVMVGKGGQDNGNS